ncbi:hypothetical protein [Ferrimonas sp. YFM]|uniref:hypothetical protein n=1 Tax=Ferrimonas sp. YFM TaxID=3028878 RepID=UPI0025729F96|nr:hypothetical protein [Ferrimonas sp. YFM]BDY05427.1 hypothetical protein F0521_24680 [Ferrimonas sp. YFM]
MHYKQLSRVATQQEIISKVNNAKFNPDLALTLTLCEVPLYEQTNLANSSVTQQQFHILENNFKRFMCYLNEVCYGRNWYRLKKNNPEKSIQILAAIEIKNHQYHFHCSVQTPTHMIQDDFKEFILKLWPKTKYGSKHENDIRPIYDLNGWISYMTKDLHKHNGLGYVSYSNFC